jgi:hypothetical protein
MNLKIKNIITFCLIGIAAYMLTDIIHEVIGHSGTCLVIGQKIKLLTSVYFKSKPGSVLTDLGGPVSNLLFGFLIFYFLKHDKNISITFRLLLTLAMFYNFYWFSGTILQSGFSRIGDFTYPVEELNVGMFGKFILLIGGFASYYFTIRLNRTQFNKINLSIPEFPLRKFVYYSYVAAAVSAIIAGLFFSSNRIMAAYEGLLEMIASLPIIFISSKDKIKIEVYSFKSMPNIFNFIVTVLFILFCFTLGRGFVL